MRIFCYLGIIGLLGSPAPAQESSAQLQAAATQALAEHDYEQAVRVLRRLVQSDPTSVAYLSDLAQAEQQLGRLDAALDTLNKLLTIEPVNEQAVTRLARILASRDDWAGVVSLLRPLAVNTLTYATCHSLAEAYRRLDQPVEAAWFYEKAVQLDPLATADFVKLGHLHLEQGRPALAIRALESVVALGLHDAKIHYELAKAYHQAGRPLGKVEIRSLAQAIPGNTADGWYVLESVSDELDRYRVCPDNSAIYHLQRAFELAADQPGLHLLHADIWYSAKHYARAREIYETIESTVPGPALAGYHYRYGHTLFWLDDLAGFQRSVEKAIEIDPQNYRPKLLEAYVLLADRYCLLGNLEQYIRYLELAVAEAPRSAEHRYNLGNALHEAHRRAEASAQWQVVLQLDPFHPDRERLLKLLNYQDLEPQAQGQ